MKKIDEEEEILFLLRNELNEVNAIMNANDPNSDGFYELNSNEK